MRPIKVRQQWESGTDSEAASAPSAVKSLTLHIAKQRQHTFQAHLIEKMRRQELRTVNTRSEAVCDHYMELYEHVPIGYLTLSHLGMIAETNRAGARMFGLSRKKLIHSRFATFVDDQDKGSALAVIIL